MGEEGRGDEGSSLLITSGQAHLTALTAMSDFVHLHLHSQFSLLDGANRLDDVIKAAVEAGMPAMALTDHGNMSAAIESTTRARAAGIKPIVGVEPYVA